MIARAARSIRLIVALGVLVGAVAASATVATAGGRSDLSRAKAASGGFHSLDRAEEAGYGVLADAAGLTCIEHANDGGMGTHLVKGALVGDGIIDASQPEALLYDRSGSRDRLLGVEYVVLATDWNSEDPPSLFGREFALVDAGNRYGLPPFYELHAWIWEDNPVGMFEDWNPRISC